MTKKYDLESKSTLDNNDYNDYVMRWGQVVASTDKDPYGAGRCMVYIEKLDSGVLGDGDNGIKQVDFLKSPEDYGHITDALPWSLPLQPIFLKLPTKHHRKLLGVEIFVPILIVFLVDYEFNIIALPSVGVCIVYVNLCVILN